MTWRMNRDGIKQCRISLATIIAESFTYTLQTQNPMTVIVHTCTQRRIAIYRIRTFNNEVEELWPRVAFTLNGACILAVIAYIHFLYLKAVLMFVANAGNNGHTWVHRPLVIPCKYDAWAIQPGSFRDTIQQVAPMMTRDASVRSGQVFITLCWCLSVFVQDQKPHRYIEGHETCHIDRAKPDGYCAVAGFSKQKQIKVCLFCWNTRWPAKQSVKT